MSIGTLGQGLGTIAGGGLVAYLSWVISRSKRYATRTADALIRARLHSEDDRDTIARGIRAAGVFGVCVGGLVVIIGVVTLFAR